MWNSFWTRCLGTFLVSCAVAVCLADPPSWGPQPSVLVLRTGRVLRGEITQVGDRFTISIGDTDEVSVPVASVDFRCHSLDDAYRRLAERLTRTATAAQHLTLAEWCLTNELLPQAAEQLIAAHRLEPENAEVTRFERRLHLAARRGETTAAAPRAKSSAVNVKLEPQVDLDQFTRQLPSGMVEQFTSSIQPLLMNRCGASACHGPNATTEYRLARPAAGRQAWRRLTQRNLYATLQFVDKETPLSSELLRQATQAHGKSRQAPIDPRETESLRQLAQWLTRYHPQAVAAGNAAPAPAVLSQSRSNTDSQVELVTHLEPIPKPSQETKSAATNSPAATSGTSPKPRTENAPSPADEAKDPFDPAAFNRRHHQRGD